MKKLFVFFSLVLSPQVALAGDIYVGRWDGINHTSIEFVAKDPLRVRYCWKSECSLHAPKGTENKMNFNWRQTPRYPGASMTFIKKGDTYYGTHQRSDETRISEVILRKQQ